VKSKNVKGFKVELDLSESYGLSDNDGGKWTMICISHAYLIQDTNKARLWRHADSVADWCEIHNEVEVA